MASWLQAFAALVALLISVWATVRVGAVERRRDRLQARGVAIAIYPELRKLVTTVEYVQKGLQELKAQQGHLVGQSVAATIQQIGGISIPPMIERHIDKLYLLGGDAASTSLQLVGSLYQYNTLVEGLTATMMTMNAEEWNTRVFPELVKNADLIGEAVEKCRMALKPIHNAGLD